MLVMMEAWVVCPLAKKISRLKRKIWNKTKLKFVKIGKQRKFGEIIKVGKIQLKFWWINNLILLIFQYRHY